jgi:hypothetical protein
LDGSCDAEPKSSSVPAQRHQKTAPGEHAALAASMIKRRILPATVKRRRLRALKDRLQATAADIGTVIGRHPVTVRKYLNGELEIPTPLLEYAEYALPLETSLSC